MKIITNTFILILFIFSTSCTHESNSPQTDLILIEGNIKGFKGTTLYLKHINPINYNSNSVIDSSLVKSNGDFEFNITNSMPLLVNISKNDRQHQIHGVFRNDPDKYYYGYCAMFYLPEPTLYLTENVTVQLDWTVAERMDSYTFDTKTNTNQEKFYNYYLTEDLGDSLYQDDGSLKVMDSRTAWNHIERAITETQDTYGLDENNLQNEFNNYLNTEITLGAINMYVNWYEYIFPTELDEAFASGMVPDMYANAINMYLDSNWNQQSVEYYKLTERFLTFNLNKSLKEFKDYYPSSDRKISMARQKLNPEIADSYIRNINLQDEVQVKGEKPIE